MSFQGRLVLATITVFSYSCQQVLTTGAGSIAGAISGDPFGATGQAGGVAGSSGGWGSTGAILEDPTGGAWGAILGPNAGNGSWPGQAGGAANTAWDGSPNGQGAAAPGGGLPYGLDPAMNAGMNPNAMSWAGPGGQPVGYGAMPPGISQGVYPGTQGTGGYNDADYDASGEQLVDSLGSLHLGNLR